MGEKLIHHGRCFSQASPCQLVERPHDVDRRGRMDIQRQKRALSLIDLTNVEKPAALKMGGHGVVTADRSGRAHRQNI